MKKSETVFNEVIQYVRISEKGDFNEYLTSAETYDITLESLQLLQEAGQNRPYYYDYLDQYFNGPLPQKETDSPPVVAPVLTSPPVVAPVVTSKPPPPLAPPPGQCRNGKSRTVYNHNIIPCKGQLIFEDNFDTLDYTKWQNVVELSSDEFDADFVSFQNNSENLYIEDGILNIVPTLLSDLTRFRGAQFLNLSDCTATVEKLCYRKVERFFILPPIVSAKIQSKNFFTFKYGRVVVTAKVPKGDWLFPLITLEPSTNHYDPSNYHSGQIRIASVRGNELLKYDNEEIGGSVLYGGPIVENDERGRTILRSKKSDELFSNRFHHYEVVWTPRSLRFLVDNKQYGEVKPSDIGYRFSRGGATLAPFDKEFHLSLGLSAGGLADFPDNSLTGPYKKRKPWDNDDPKQEFRFKRKMDEWLSTWDHDSSLKVDSVKVYALE